MMSVSHLNGAQTAQRTAPPAAVAPFAPGSPAKPEKPGGFLGAQHAARLRANGADNGAPVARGGPGFAAPRPRLPAPGIDAATVIYRLEEAGTALLALPPSGYGTRLRTSQLDVVRTAIESYGWTGGRLRPAMPDAARITRMDEAMAWIPLIPLDRYVLRRIVGARSLVSPSTERHLFPWRRLAALLGADHKAVQRWHAQGIDLIVAALNGR